MYSMKEHPVQWVLENGIGFALLYGLQTIIVLWVMKLSTINIKQTYRYIIYVTTQSIFMYISSFFFDTDTHIMGSVACAVVFAFPGVLRAFAYLHLREFHRKTYNPTFLQVFINMTIPLGDKNNPKATRNSTLVMTMRSVVLYVLLGFSLPVLRSSMNLFKNYEILQTIVILSFTFLVVNSLLCLFSVILSNEVSPFQAPFLSPTQAKFWAGRWNAPVSDALRAGVMNPLMDNGVTMPVAILCCFVVSGICHELLLLFAGVPVGQSYGEWMIFFTAAGLSTAFEKFVLSACKRRHIVIPGWVIRAWGIFILFSLACRFFVRVIIRWDIAIKIVTEMSWVKLFPINVYNFVRSKLVAE